MPEIPNRDLPHAYWEGNKIVITPRASEQLRDRKILAWMRRHRYIEKIELRPLTLTNRRAKTKRAVFKAVAIYNDGKEEVPTANLLKKVCPEQGETWHIWNFSDTGKCLIATRQAAMSWLQGGQQVITWPCLLQENNTQ